MGVQELCWAMRVGKKRVHKNDGMSCTFYGAKLYINIIKEGFWNVFRVFLDDILSIVHTLFNNVLI